MPRNWVNLPFLLDYLFELSLKLLTCKHSPGSRGFLIRTVGGGVQLGPLGTTATNWRIMSAPGDYDDGEIGGMMTDRGNRSTRRKPVLVPLCPEQTPHAARTQTWAAAVGSQRLTA
jgi:hypothetical protein